MDDCLEIATERLTLRPLALEHLAALHEIFADRQAMRFWHTPPHSHSDETRTMIERFIAGPQHAWAVCSKDDRHAIGLIYYLGNPGPPGMGYILAPAHWGKGLMTEAVRGALAFGFERLGLDRVELWIDSRNLASQRVAERTGFKRRSAFPMQYLHEATPHEKLVYGIRAEEWRPGSGTSRRRLIEAYSLHPVLPVKDVRTTAEYYRDKLGFEIVFIFGTPARYGAVTLREWTATGAHIRLRQVDTPPPAEGLSLYLKVGPGIEALYETYKARGVDFVSELSPMSWGECEFAIRDCNGYVLEFAAPG